MHNSNPPLSPMWELVLTARGFHPISRPGYEMRTWLRDEETRHEVTMLEIDACVADMGGY